MNPETIKCVENSNQSIGTLNVCGIKSRIKYPDFIVEIMKYDMCKIDEYDDIVTDDYQFLKQSRKQTVLCKYGGLGFVL